MRVRAGEPTPGPDGIRAAIFDLGGVMLEPFFRGLEVPPEYMGLLDFFLRDARDVYDLPTGDHDVHLLEIGRIGEREFFGRLCRRYADEGNELVDPDLALAALWGREMVASSAMVDTVRRVRSAGYRTALLTNISRGAAPMWRGLLPVDDLFDVLVDSSVVGLRKPDARIFHLTVERLGVGAHECLFVDDLECNVDAAAALGMITVHCLDPTAAAVEVAGRLVEPATTGC